MVLRKILNINKLINFYSGRLPQFLDSSNSRTFAFVLIEVTLEELMFIDSLFMYDSS